MIWEVLIIFGKQKAFKYERIKQNGRNMKIPKITFIVLIFLCSCIHLRVRPKYFHYCPYKVNDIVVFENATTSGADTIFINSIQDHREADGPVPIFINRHTYCCCGYTSEIRTSFFTKPRDHDCLMTIIPKYKAFEDHRDNNGIEFSIYKHNSLYLECFVKFEDLSKMNTTSISVNGMIYNDVLEIYANMKNKSAECVKVFYWRNDLGYLKFITNDGTEYFLKDKFNSPEILKKIINEERIKEEKWRKGIE